MRIAALAAVPFLVAGTMASAQCRADRVVVTGDWGRATFQVELADDPAERSQGLMHVRSMPTLSGMLFIYESPQQVSFWMRNTLIPLDMVFVGDDGQIVNIHENAKPLDDTPINGGEDVFAVLEINGGMVARLGIKVGDVLQHPGFGEAAVLPCES